MKATSSVGLIYFMYVTMIVTNNHYTGIMLADDNPNKRIVQFASQINNISTLNTCIMHCRIIVKNLCTIVVTI